MSISVTFSSTSGGLAISEPLSHGSKGAGNSTTAQTIFLRHDGNNPITNCKLYIKQKSGSYTGARTAAQDLALLLAWGDVSTEVGFGGLQFNFDAAGSFPAGSWGTYSDKDPSNGYTARTGVADSAANGLLIPTAAGVSSPGVVVIGTTPGVSFQVRLKIPSGAGLGIVQFDLGLSFDYVS